MATKRTEVRGYGDLLDRLSAVQRDLAGEKMTAVVLGGAKIIRSQVESYAPKGWDSKKPGSLKKAAMAIPNRVRPGRPPSAVVLINYAPRRGRVAPHAHLVEGGTKKHLIVGKVGKPLVLVNGRVFRAAVRHPGTKPRPFFEDAVRSKRSTARQYVREGAVRLIEETIRSTK